LRLPSRVGGFSVAKARSTTTSGGTLTPAPFGWAFQSGAAVQTDLVARDAAGRVLARVALPRR
jgi:hypothetical protein